ncbi:MAG: NAD+ synthase [Chlamydiia bacterium]
MRIALAQLNPIIGDLEGNQKAIREAIRQAKAAHADIVVTPELAICGYPPQDFVQQAHFVAQAAAAARALEAESSGILLAVGTIRMGPGTKPVRNSAAIFMDGVFHGYADKMLLPTYDVFDEARYFAEGSDPYLVTWRGHRVAITICEDIWGHAGRVQTRYARDPVEELARMSPNLCLNLSASPFEMGKVGIREEVVLRAAQTLRCPVAYCNAVGAQDMLIFDGRSLLVTPERVIYRAPAFEEGTFVTGLHPPHGETILIDHPVEEVYHALVLGIRDFCRKQNLHTAIIGVSGGIDSAVVLALAVDALGPEAVFGVFMPSEVTSPLSYQCVRDLFDKIPCQQREMRIDGPLDAFGELLHEDMVGLVRENVQARIRGVLLMALANRLAGIVLSTGNKSELAMGYCTLYGDMAGGLAVLADVPKSLVYQLATFINRDKERIPVAIIDRPPTAELRPNQLDSDQLPPYSLIDEVVAAYLESNKSPERIAIERNLNVELVEEILQRVHRNEFKRRQSPPGLRVTSKAFGIGRHFPIVQGFYR